jgi:hypothetical protein
MSVEEYTKEKLWEILVETAHRLVMYPYHKAYTKDVILHEKPEITPTEVAARLNMPLGEALIILHELAEEKDVKSSNLA